MGDGVIEKDICHTLWNITYPSAGYFYWIVWSDEN